MTSNYNGTVLSWIEQLNSKLHTKMNFDNKQLKSDIDIPLFLYN